MGTFADLQIHGDYSWTAGPLKMGQIIFPETSVTTNLQRVISQKSKDVMR